MHINISEDIYIYIYYVYVLHKHQIRCLNLLDQIEMQNRIVCDDNESHSFTGKINILI